MTAWGALILAKWEAESRGVTPCLLSFLFGKISPISEEYGAWEGGTLFLEMAPLMPARPVSSLMWVIPAVDFGLFLIQRFYR